MVFHLWGTPHLFLNVVGFPFLIGNLLVAAPILFLARTFFWAFRPEKNVRGKVVLITGASSGIGANVAFEYAKRGALLVLAARREQNLKQVADQARRLGSPDVKIVPADVTKEEDCKKMVDVAIEAFGRLDVLWNNAGIAQWFFFQEASTTSGFKKVFDTDVLGYIYTTYYALPYLKQTHGQIVANASILGYCYQPGTALYCAAKHAVIGFFDTLRSEIGSEVDVTIICPGFIKSEMTDGKTFYDEAGEEPTPQEAKERRNAIAGGLYPVLKTNDFAAGAVFCAQKRQRYGTVSFWYWAFFYYRVFAPELLDWQFKALILPRKGGKPSVAKTILDKVDGGMMAPSIETLKKEGHKG